MFCYHGYQHSVQVRDKIIDIQSCNQHVFLHITGAQKPQKETNANITANVSFSLAPMEEHVTMKSQCYIHVHVHQHMEELIAQNVCDNNCVQFCHC